MICIRCWNFNLYLLPILFSFIVLGISNAEERENTIIITGVITNIEKAKEYIDKDSYLQLVYIPPNGTILAKTDWNGRTIYESDLAKINIPSDGAFTFKTSDLASGKYVISAQAIMPAGIGRKPLLGIKGTKKVAIIDVPDATKKPIRIEIGELFIAVP